MNKVRHLVIGDPHVKISNLDDSTAIIDHAIKVIKSLDPKPEAVVILGDLLDTHAIVRLEILDFWRKSLTKISQGFTGEIIIMSGNHDITNPKDTDNAVSAITFLHNSSNIVKVSRSPMFRNGILYCPYIQHDKFLETVNPMLEAGDIKFMYAHQTFTGAKYENNFPAPDGIEQDLIKVATIVSGHIHSSSQFGKVFYPGTPKWDTMADANHEKSIWVLDIDIKTGRMEKMNFPMDKVVRSITSFHIKEGEELPVLNPNNRNYVILEGKSSWITKTKVKFANANIKVMPTDKQEKRISTRPSENIVDFLNNKFEQVAGVSKEEIQEYLNKL